MSARGKRGGRKASSSRVKGAPERSSNDNENATLAGPPAEPGRKATRAKARSRTPEVGAAPVLAPPALGVAELQSAVSNFAERREKLRILEAVLFASSQPLDEAKLATFLKPGDEVKSLIAELKSNYAGRGVNLVRVAGKWAFRTAEDLSFLLERNVTEERRLSKAALETLAIVAYHQPCTRAEIEEVRGVSTSAGTLDILLETGWVRPRGRRRAPGRPVTYGTTEQFLAHFGLDAIRDLPGLAELKGSGLLDGNLPPGFAVPEPTDTASLMPDELPLDPADEGEQTELELEVEQTENSESDRA